MSQGLSALSRTLQSGRRAKLDLRTSQEIIQRPAHQAMSEGSAEASSLMTFKSPPIPNPKPDHQYPSSSGRPGMLKQTPSHDLPSIVAPLTRPLVFPQHLREGSSIKTKGKGKEVAREQSVEDGGCKGREGERGTDSDWSFGQVQFGPSSSSHPSSHRPEPTVPETALGFHVPRLDASMQHISHPSTSSFSAPSAPLQPA